MLKIRNWQDGFLKDEGVGLVVIVGPRTAMAFKQKSNFNRNIVSTVTKLVNLYSINYI